MCRNHPSLLKCLLTHPCCHTCHSDGWFLFPAGRRPRHQLIGDTIDKYGGELDDCVMVQYNSLQNPHLLARGGGGSPDVDCIAGYGPAPDMDHEAFIEKLKDFSVSLWTVPAYFHPPNIHRNLLTAVDL